MSRCTSPAACAACRPAAAWASTSMVAAGSSGPAASTPASDGPSTSSITRYGDSPPRPPRSRKPARCPGESARRRAGPRLRTWPASPGAGRTRPQQLDRDRPAEDQVIRPPDLAHRAGGDPAVQAVAARDNETGVGHNRPTLPAARPAIRDQAGPPARLRVGCPVPLARLPRRAWMGTVVVAGVSRPPWCRAPAGTGDHRGPMMWADIPRPPGDRHRVSDRCGPGLPGEHSIAPRLARAPRSAGAGAARPAVPP